jgi:DNA-binding XRE family transcriptional regulator
MKKLADGSIPARELFASVRRDNPEIARAEAEMGSKLTVARNVLRLRVRAGMSQAELAQRIGTSQPRIAQIEAARVNVTIETLDRIAAAFSVQTATLFKPAMSTAPQASPASAI